MNKAEFIYLLNQLIDDCIDAEIEYKCDNLADCLELLDAALGKLQQAKKDLQAELNGGAS